MGTYTVVETCVCTVLEVQLPMTFAVSVRAALGMHVAIVHGDAITHNLLEQHPVLQSLLAIIASRS